VPSDVAWEGEREGVDDCWREFASGGGLGVVGVVVIVFVVVGVSVVGVPHFRGLDYVVVGDGYFVSGEVGSVGRVEFR